MRNIFVVLSVCLLYGCGSRDQTDVINKAYSFPNGGGTCSLKESGVPLAITINGNTILKKCDSGTYCCGFTFGVAMDVANGRGLLKTKSAAQIKQMQRQWYGAIPGSKEKLLVDAMTSSGIGEEVVQSEAQKGDFIQFWRESGSGHSVIFLDWIKEEDVIVGFKYRSSQESTHGIGDNQEYFTTSHYGKMSKIDPKRFYVGRLK